MLGRTIHDGPWDRPGAFVVHDARQGGATRDSDAGARPEPDHDSRGRRRIERT